MPPCVPSAELNGTVIVTGGASGLGAAVAAAVETAGGTPVVLDLNPPPNGFPFERVDLSDTRAAEAVVARVAEAGGGLRGVVTAAGTDACGRLDDVPGQTWEGVAAGKLLGPAGGARRRGDPARPGRGRPRRAAAPRARARARRPRRGASRPEGRQRRDRVL